MARARAYDTPLHGLPSLRSPLHEEFVYSVRRQKRFHRAKEEATGTSRKLLHYFRNVPLFTRRLSVYTSCTRIDVSCGRNKSAVITRVCARTSFNFINYTRLMNREEKRRRN